MSSTSREGLLALCGSCLSLSTLTVSLRFYGRYRQGVRLGIDDWTALFGVVTFIGACAMAIEREYYRDHLWTHPKTDQEKVVVLKADGYDSDTLTPAQAKARAKPTVQVSLAYDFLIMNTLACSKLSALFLYRRIFTLPRYGSFNAIIWTTVVIIAMWYVTFDVLSCFQCRGRFSAFWDGTFKKYCDLNPVWAKGLAISDFILDLWILLLPVPLIWRLHASTPKKLSIIGVFLLAFIGLGASIARIVVFVTTKAPGAETLYIGVLETGISITVVNLPSLWYICVGIFPGHVLRSSHSSHGKDSSPSVG